MSEVPPTDYRLDVVIPAHEKDIDTLDMCIERIRKNVRPIRNITVVSAYRLTDQADWFPESQYEFSIHQVMLELSDCIDQHGPDRARWYYQQLLTLYAPVTIPGLTSGVLLVDADVLFLRPISFLRSGRPQHTLGRGWRRSFDAHLSRLLPSMGGYQLDQSGVCHHMLMERHVVRHLIQEIEDAHPGLAAWQAFLRCVDVDDYSKFGASEYDTYFHFVQAYHHTHVDFRWLRWADSDDLDDIHKHEQDMLHFVAYHKWRRDTKERRRKARKSPE